MRTGTSLTRRWRAGATVLAAATVVLLAAAPSGDAAATGTGASPIYPPNGTPTPAWSFVPLSNPNNHLTRSSIQLLASPGQVVSDTAVLTNYSTQALNFNIYGSDASNTVKLGAFALNPPNAKKVAVGSWITLPVNIYDLPPHTSTQFHFSVKVPTNASPGDHAGGIVALNLAPASKEKGTTVAIQRGEGIAVYVRVPGPLHPGVAAANIGAKFTTPAIGFGSAWALVHYQVVNTGNTILNGTATAEAVNIFGSVIKKFAPAQITTLIPGQRMSVVEPKWDGLPFIGPVHIKVVMKTTKVNATGEGTFWVFPWLFVLLVLLVIGGLIGWWVWRRRRRQGEATPGGEGNESGPAEGAAPESDEPSERTNAGAGSDQPATVG